jgi:hypothetical protein
VRLGIAVSRCRRRSMWPQAEQHGQGLGGTGASRGAQWRERAREQSPRQGQGCER